MAKSTKLGKLILDARTLADLSQADLACRLGLKSGQSISNIESGLIVFPRKCLPRLSETLSLDPKMIAECITADIISTYFTKEIGSEPIAGEG